MLTTNIFLDLFYSTLVLISPRAELITEAINRKGCGIGITWPGLCSKHFQTIGPKADSFIESRCPCIYLSVCLLPM